MQQNDLRVPYPAKTIGIANQLHKNWAAMRRDLVRPSSRRTALWRLVARKMTRDGRSTFAEVFIGDVVLRKSLGSAPAAMEVRSHALSPLPLPSAHSGGTEASGPRLCQQSFCKLAATRGVLGAAWEWFD